MKPNAAPHRWPYSEHRTLAQVDADEKAERIRKECGFTRKQVAA